MLKQAPLRTVLTACATVLLLLLTGCGILSGGGNSPITGEPEPAGDYEGLLAAEKRAPAFDRLQDGVLIAIAREPEAYSAMWTLYRLDGSPPPVDFDEQVVLFFAMGESGSCPLVLNDVTVEAGSAMITAHVATGVGSDVPCTDDWTPRTFVVALDRGEIPDGRLQGRITGDHVERVQGVLEW